MNKVKIVHGADFHFDTPFKEVDETQSKINREELKEVFTDIISFCGEQKIEILLLAGDLFDNYTLNRETLFFIERELRRIPNTKIFISPGNHDPYSRDSFYKIINWPSNVHIFKSSLEKVELENVNVWGAAFNDKYVRESMIKGFNYNDNKINIMVIHGEVAKGSEENEYNPITLSQIANSGMDYIALGHRHSFSGVKKENNTSYAYSGCPQGRGFDETGDKGIIYGYVSKNTVDLKFYKTCKRNYEEINIDITSLRTNDEIADKIINEIDEEKRKSNLYKIFLTGEIDEEVIVDEDILKEKLKRYFYYCKVINKTKVKLNIEEITKGYSVKSVFAKKLLARLGETEDEEEKDIIMDALKIGLASLSETEVNIDDN